GQFPPAALRVASGLADRPWYVDDPWSVAASTPLAPNGSALLVGTGLTAVDVAVAILEFSPGARVHLVSRRAQLPAPQRETPAYRDWLDPADAPSRVGALMRLVRREVARAEAEGVSWRAVIDALKPHVPGLWARLPLVERRRFLRHARSYWEAHRNRLPPPTAARVADWTAEGRLVVHAGRLKALSDDGTGALATVAARGGGEAAWHVDRVINCTGPDTQYRQITHPLVLDLIGTGLARPDPLGLGLDVAPDGRLKDEDGLAEQPLYTLGWPRQGQLWEATTVPSLREQARDVARRVLGGA
ncbi:MAG: FAD/NAD(P)-binding protein, partial [Candidatus Sericytochromatia bacterium]